MAHWKISDTFREPRVAPTYVVKKTQEDGQHTYSTEIEGCLHAILIAMADKILPGDIIETPEGFSFVHNPVAEVNN